MQKNMSSVLQGLEIKVRPIVKDTSQKGASRNGSLASHLEARETVQLESPEPWSLNLRVSSSQNPGIWASESRDSGIQNRCLHHGQSEGRGKSALPLPEGFLTIHRKSLGRSHIIRRAENSQPGEGAKEAQPGIGGEIIESQRKTGEQSCAEPRYKCSGGENFPPIEFGLLAGGIL